MNLYFTGCQHYQHNEIIKLCNRPFLNVDDQNKKLIDNYNSIVTNNDMTYNLGDFFLNDTNEIVNPYDIIKMLNGQQIFVCGNHDGKYRSGLNVHNKEIILKIKKLDVQLVHSPSDARIDYSLCIHSHVHNEYKIRELKYNNKSTLLFNCGVDVNNYKPVELQDILSLYYQWDKIKYDYTKVREFLNLHNKGTNFERKK